MGDSGIGIIRISGDTALQIVNQIFQPVNKNKTILNINSDMKLGIEISENLKQFLGYHRNIFENKNT